MLRVMGLRLLAVTVVAVACAACGTAAEEIAADEADLSTGSPSLDAIRAAVANVDEGRVTLTDIASPTESAEDGTRGEAVSLFGIEWRQKWPGGKSGDPRWETGTPEGRRCAWASLLRFEAIFRDPPKELMGRPASFHNRNDDYSGTSSSRQPAIGDAKSGAILGAGPETVSWVSATAKDGSCHLPTRGMVIAWAGSLTQEGADPRGQ
jgi:hypothetical protein